MGTQARAIAPECHRSATPVPLRRRVTREITENTELLGALALVAIYFALMSGHLISIDGLIVYQQGESLAYGHSVHFRPFFWGNAGFTTSSYGIGGSLIYVPTLLLASSLRSAANPAAVRPDGGIQMDWINLYKDPLYTVAVAPLFVLATALAAYLVARFLRELGYDRRIALWGLAFVGLGSPAVVYARGDFAQPIEALCWIAAFYTFFRFGRTRQLRFLCLSGFTIVYAVLTRQVEGALLCAALLVMLPWLWRQGRRCDAGYAFAGITAAALIGLLGTLAADWARFGSPFDTGAYATQRWTTPLMLGLSGALISPARGILWSFPAVVLVPLGLRHLSRSRYRWVGLALLALPIAQILNVSAWWIWFGGWDWGLRLFVPALPLLAVLAAAGVDALTPSVRRWLPPLLLLAGVVWVLPCVLTDMDGGYAAAYGSTEQSFVFRAYPPAGAWPFVAHVLATSPTDTHAIDVLWLHVARETNYLSLVAPLLLLVVALLLALRVRRVLRHPLAANVAASA
jgi:hypothetical protein